MWREISHFLCRHNAIIRILINEATLILEVVQYLLSTNLNLDLDHVIILILDHLRIVFIDLTHGLPFSVTWTTLTVKMATAIIRNQMV